MDMRQTCSPGFDRKQPLSQSSWVRGAPPGTATLPQASKTSPGAGRHGPSRFTAYSLLCVNAAPTRARQGLAALALYALLFLLGWLQGLIGCFQFSRSLGRFPAGALLFDLLILATCVLAGIGMESPLGALLPALGWFGASLVLSLPTPGGSVIVTNSTAGKWYLYGGAVCAGLGIVSAFRAGHGRRSPSAPGPGMPI
jgi:hypothetical protein